MTEEQKELVTKIVDEASILRSGLNHTSDEVVQRVIRIREYAGQVQDIERSGPLESERNAAAEQSMLEQRDARVEPELNPPSEPLAGEDPAVNDDPDAITAAIPIAEPEPPAPSVPRKSGRKHQH